MQAWYCAHSPRSTVAVWLGTSIHRLASKGLAVYESMARFSQNGAFALLWPIPAAVAFLVFLLAIPIAIGHTLSPSNRWRRLRGIDPLVPKYPDDIVEGLVDVDAVLRRGLDKFTAQLPR
jgi:hypothetical protein